VLLIPILSLLIRADRRDMLLPLTVVLYFFLFNLTFDGWTGGWGAGPRYLICAMAFLFAFAAPAWIRYRKLCWVLIAASCLTMLAITAYSAQFPANTFGPPSSDRPVAESMRR